MGRLDAWKRELPSAVDDAANVMSGYEQQLELQLNKTVDATPEEAEAWQKNELDWWGDKQLMFVAIASLVQLSALGFMLSCFYLISKAFS
jgi:hypothetical protein|tara:strand:+ start:112 stop:381 length:270 start_codon:yes stop_codon:yes gene_type:complete